jgi:hypothetical protein
MICNPGLPCDGSRIDDTRRKRHVWTPAAKADKWSSYQPYMHSRWNHQWTSLNAHFILRPVGYAQYSRFSHVCQPVWLDLLFPPRGASCMNANDTLPRSHSRGASADMSKDRN